MLPRWSLKPTLNVKGRQVPVPQLYCQLDILMFRHLPALLLVFRSSMGTKKLHTYGCTTEHHHSRERWRPSDAGALDATGIKIRCDIKHKALAPESASKVEIQRTDSVVAYFQVALYNSFFNIQSRFFWWIFGRGNCLANSFIYYRWKNVNY